jgi:type I restriction enzyme R subunit
MAEIETTMEMRLINQLTQGDSQWTYCKDLNTEDKLWKNFRTILENNNRNKLNERPLTDQEFEQVKNQIVSPSFFEAGKKLAGENGIFHVIVNRVDGPIQLTVFNRYQKTGGNTTYQVIHQFESFKDEEDPFSRDRRFDVTFLFNGLPLIHMELKNGFHSSYQEAFNQIKKYINEGRFKGIFSMVQMFVISNGVATKYFAASEEPNFEFLTGWSESDANNTPVNDLFAFAKDVLRIPEAHQMITEYAMLDATKRNIVLLRPYQIHAIEAIERASYENRSGYIWHTTGSGKTLTSYKVARDLLFDIPSLQKTIFLIDRKDLDDKTNDDFKSYAENDAVDVEETESTEVLQKKLAESKRQMIVTTIQKMQHLIKNLSESPESKISLKISDLKVAFVVDECHRTVTKQTQNLINHFFKKHLWYGFTGTPIFVENQGALGATTKDLYGDCLHSYTIKEALKDGAVLGFQVENDGPKGLETDLNGDNINEDIDVYSSEAHMLHVLEIILNKSQEKLGIKNGPGNTYEAILTTHSIQKAQRYYELLKKVKAGQTQLHISDEILKILPDFPRFAITYSLTDNQESSEVDAGKMAIALSDYNEMFGTHFNMSQIDAYNTNLTERLARKKDAFKARRSQLDIVIVADRLLTGFDAPCLSTLFADRQPATPHGLIQSFSRTNRIFDKNKKTGYIVTFQSPGTYKNRINSAIKLFSNGGTDSVLGPSFADAEKDFIDALRVLRIFAPTPSSCASLENESEKASTYCALFQNFDRCFARLKTYIDWLDKDLAKNYGLSDSDYRDYVAWYKILILLSRGEPGGEGGNGGGKTPADGYELLSYSTETINYEYIVRLIQDFIKDSSISKADIDEYVATLSKENPKLGAILKELWDRVQANANDYKDKDLRPIFEKMKEDAIKHIIDDVSKKMFLKTDDVYYSSRSYYSSLQSDIPNFGTIVANADLNAYNNATGQNLRLFQYNSKIHSELKTVFDNDILPLKSE